MLCVPWQLAQLATTCEPPARRQPMVAGQIGGLAAAFDAKLLRESHAFVAARARGLRDVLRRYRRVGIRVRFDGMDAVTIGAHRRLPVALGDRLPVNALLKFF